MLTFGILAVPELNSVLALICHQRYSISEISPGSSDRTPDLFQELNYCLGNKHAQADLSRFLMYRQLVAGLLGAISTPILSSLSDRIGRRPILACTAVGPLIKDVLFLLTLWYPDFVDVHWLLVGYAIEGLSGEFIIATSTSQAYVTDLVPTNDRARIFSYLEAGVSFALTLGPTISGILLAGSHSFQVIFEFAICIHLLLAFTFLCILPESRKLTVGKGVDQDEVYTEQQSEAGCIQSVCSSFKSIRTSGASRQRNMGILTFVDFIRSGIIIGMVPLEFAYGAFAFHWKPTMQSFASALVSSWSIIVLTMLFPSAMTLVRRWSSRVNRTNVSVLEVGEVGAIKFCLMLQVIGYIGVSLTREPGPFIVSYLVVASATPMTPLLISCLTAHMPSHQSGQLLGILSFLHAISRVVMPAVMNATYSMTVGLFPVPLFLLLAIIYGLALLATMCIKANVP